MSSNHVDQDKEKQNVAVAKPPLLQRISIFKDPVPTTFGGILTAFLPVILLFYAIYLSYEKVNNTPLIQSNATEIDYEQGFTVTFQCTSEFGCLFYQSQYAIADEVKVVQQGEEYTTTVYFLDSDPVIAVAHAACFTNATVKNDCADSKYIPQINTKVFWQTQNNASTLPQFPVGVIRKSADGTKRTDLVRSRSGVWSSKIKVSRFTDVDGKTTEDFALTSPEETNQIEYPSYFPEENIALFEKVCGAIPATCDKDQLILDGKFAVYDEYYNMYFGTPDDPEAAKPFATFATIAIEPEIQWTQQSRLNYVEIGFEIVGQIGGAYSLIMGALKGIHTLYLYATGKIKKQDAGKMLKEIYDDTKGDGGPKKSAPF